MFLQLQRCFICKCDWADSGFLVFTHKHYVFEHLCYQGWTSQCNGHNEGQHGWPQPLSIQRFPWCIGLLTSIKYHPVLSSSHLAARLWGVPSPEDAEEDFPHKSILKGRCVLCMWMKFVMRGAICTFLLKLFWYATTCIFLLVVKIMKFVFPGEYDLFPKTILTDHLNEQLDCS